MHLVPPKSTHCVLKRAAWTSGGLEFVRLRLERRLCLRKVWRRGDGRNDVEGGFVNVIVSRHPFRMALQCRVQMICGRKAPANIPPAEAFGQEEV